MKLKFRKQNSAISTLVLAGLLLIAMDSSLFAKTSFQHNPHSPEEMNQKFKSADFKVEKFLERFEAEDREVYVHRNEIVAALDIKPGIKIADIGSGTGLFTDLLVEATGESGWTYAVDISPGFTDYVRNLSKKKGWNNLSCVLSREDSICLPENSIDLAFVCNTYHHFGQADKVLESIKKALKPGGELVVIDFDRVEHKSREWILKHIHKSADSVRSEIEKSGFKFSETKKLKGLNENYFLIFKKAE